MATGDPEVVRVLNGLLTTELTAINQYFVHYKIAQHWGYGKLADAWRKASMDEMHDAEALADRVLQIGGLPNFQRLGAFQVGETVLEQLNLALALEESAVAQLREGIAACEREGDPATGTMLRSMIVEEEEQLAWLNTQLEMVRQMGDVNYLTVQVGD